MFDCSKRFTELILCPRLTQLLQNISVAESLSAALIIFVDNSAFLAFDNTAVIGERSNPETLILGS